MPSVAPRPKRFAMAAMRSMPVRRAVSKKNTSQECLMPSRMFMLP